VDQEGIYADGVEFRIVGHDDSLAKPVFMSSIGDFWDDQHENHYVRFLARKAGSDTVTDQYGRTIKVWDATGYASKSLPGSVGDTLSISGVPTMENYGLRFRCDSAVVSATGLASASSVSSHVDPVPAGATGSPLTLAATATTNAGTYLLAPIADSQVASGNPTTNYGTTGNLYIQSASSGYGNERAWLKFDLSAIPAGSAISNATLQLWNWKAAGASMPAEVRGGSDDSWTEAGITWNNQPAFGAALSTQTLVGGTTTPNVWYNWDVTSFVQSKMSGNKLVSLVVKPVTEGSTDSPSPSYAFDSKEYGSNAPVLQVSTQTGSAAISQVQFYYRYSADNTTWGVWTPYATVTASPYATTFNYPQGYGYYEFYSRATDSNNYVEPAPAAAQAATHYTAAPPYTTEAILTFGGLTWTFDGTPKPATVNTIPAGLALSVTYNGSTNVPVDSGSYQVSATVTQSGYTGSLSGLLYIAKATASVTIGNLNFTYDGSPKNVTATTNPTGLAVTITYDGSLTPPVSAGTYAVVATVNDPNYQGTATGTMTIADAQAAPVPALGMLGVLAAVGGLLAMSCGRRREG
jgi:hypothetical protein